MSPQASLTPAPHPLPPTAVRLALLLGLLLSGRPIAAAEPARARLPAALATVLQQTRPLTSPRGDRWPLLVLPISQTLAGIPDADSITALRELQRRGIAYSVAWNPGAFTNSAAEALRIAAFQRELGTEIVVDATACLSSFFDGSEATLHVDDQGHAFADRSLGPQQGCPFALAPRIPEIAARVDAFVEAYRRAGLTPDLVFADWEIDGPIEWNDAWASSKRCRRCREHLPGTRLDDFRSFQRRLRELRSGLQRDAYASRILAAFPRARVGNYGVNPHDGVRYWYDYFEKEVPDGVPFRAEQKARYREWAHEFPGTGFNDALPVIYTWYPMFGWYDFAETDYRWFRPMLLEGSSVGRSTPPSVPIIPFVHWTTTAPPEHPDPAVAQFSPEKYQELLWHLLLRGHDTFFLWCMPDELGREIALVHEVYAESLKHRELLGRGTPVSFEVPERPAPVVSAVRLGDQVLARRTDFGAARTGDVVLRLEGGGTVSVPRRPGLQFLEVRPRAAEAGLIRDGARLRFPIGFYEMPSGDAELRALAEAGVNLVRCGNRQDLDRAQRAGLLGWVPLPFQTGPTEALRRQIAGVVDHPALAVWEGPDEVVWNFTAWSGLEKTAGFTREGWNRQLPAAVDYAAKDGVRTLDQLRAGIRLLRELDPARRAVWINEAADSDATYVRSYLGDVEITGCDYYPVRGGGTDLAGIGRATDRWRALGQDRPVWMVLQSFSWHAIRTDRARRYPSPDESRFMIWDAIAHGARGILHWGSETIDDPEFRRALHRAIRELADQESFLAGEPVPDPAVRLIDEVQDPAGGSVRAALRRSGNDYLLALVNEDARRHLAVEVSGLDLLEGRTLRAINGRETLRVVSGSALTRLQPHAVCLLTTQP